MQSLSRPISLPLPASTGNKKTFVLPDASVLSIPQCTRFQAPEALFSPSLCNKALLGVHALTHAAIAGCEAAVQPQMYSRVLLAGGGSLFPGFAERMKTELEALAKTSVSAGVKRCRVG